MEELAGIVSQVRLRNSSGFIIFQIQSPTGDFIVTGEDSDIHEADVVRCTGNWATYKGEKQFKAKSIVPEIPSTTDAILAYLSAGRIKGVNATLAARLVAEFGKHALEVIEQSPQKLRKVRGFGQVKIKAITEGIRDQIGYRSILVFLHGFGLNKRHINKIYKHYGVGAVEAIQKDPYALCYEVEGIGFTIADRIGLRSGIDSEDPKRILAGTLHTLNEGIFINGDTGLERGNLISESVRLLSRESLVSDELVVTALEQMLESALANEIDVDGSTLIFPRSMYRAEQTIAKCIQRLTNQFQGVAHRNMNSLIDNAEQRLGITLAPQQRQAVHTSSAAGFSIITGGPGTGKTTIVRALLDCMMKGFGYTEEDILLCAPTGKASKRIEETTGLSAKTMHRALGYSVEKDGFLHDKHDQLDAKLIVIDEGSMIDTLLASWFIQAVSAGAQVIILGDVDQLPSVGPGKVLKDLIDSGCVAVTRLNHIFRQGPESHIIANAYKINNGEMPELNNGTSSDFWFVSTNEDEALANQVISLVRRAAKYLKIDELEDVQVITPMHKGVVGQATLNNRLQAFLNPHAAPGIKLKQGETDVEFKVGDKVMHTRNNKELQVFNGDTGRIAFVDVAKRTLKVSYDGRLVEYAFVDLNDLKLAYAMTIHKSQGSEYHCVIIVCSMSHYTMLYRNLMYTAITRGKGSCIVVGDKRAMQVAVSRESIDKRLTGLLHHVRQLCPSIAN